jgi:hypothetical protein
MEFDAPSADAAPHHDLRSELDCVRTRRRSLVHGKQGRPSDALSARLNLDVLLGGVHALVAMPDRLVDVVERTRAEAVRESVVLFFRDVFARSVERGQGLVQTPGARLARIDGGVIVEVLPVVDAGALACAALRRLARTPVRAALTNVA